MGSSWKRIPLGDLISLQRGHDLPSQSRVEGGVPIMGSSGLTGWHNTSKCKGPGVVVGRSGNSMGVVSYSESDFWPLNTCLYVTDFKGNDVTYIYYMLQQINFDQFNSGSAQKSLNRNAVYPFEVLATEDKDEQRRIGKLLSDFERKITLNRQINQTLEQMAQTLFKSWFVDFDPVIDNALDAGNPIPDELQHRAEARNTVRESEGFKPLPDDVRQLFPDAFEESELGWVPKGWEV
ncbi:restriction endonuclease subunit S, partial [Vibrio cholerae]|uniref:restriction endonuclease subunit S n=2 Tax=Vibrionaceae TaxID=641 RepID=UPI002270E3D2